MAYIAVTDNFTNFWRNDYLSVTVLGGLIIFVCEKRIPHHHFEHSYQSYSEMNTLCKTYQLGSIKASSSIQLSATGRLLDIRYMCYEFGTPLFPAQLLQARQSDLSVTSIPQSVTSDVIMNIHDARTPSISYRPHTHLLSRSDW